MKIILFVFLLFTTIVKSEEEYLDVEDGTIEDQENQQQVEEEPFEQKIIRPRRPQPVKERIAATSKNYTMEIIVGVLLVGYFVYFFVLKSMNSKIVTDYAQHVHESIFKVFKRTNSDSGKVGIMSVTNNNYVVECYDNEILKGACLYFNLIKRQELFSHLLTFVTGDQDELMIDVVLDKKYVPPCIFAVCKQRQEKKFRKMYEELNKLCKTRSGSALKLSDKFVGLSDAFESTGIITKEFIEFIERYEKQFNYFILSDQSTSIEGEKCLLRMSVKIDDVSILSKACDLAFKIALNLKKVTIESRILEKCKKIRKEIEEAEEKEKEKKRREEIQLKRDEEKQKMYDRMTSEERRKYDEKMRNKMIKRKQTQVKVKMG